MSLKSVAEHLKILYHHRTQGEEPESIHILAIVNALREMGHDVKIVGPSGKDMRGVGANARLLAGVKARLPRVLFEIAQLLYNAVAYRQLVKVIRAYRPDLIYERYALYDVSGVIAAKCLRVPLVLEINTPYAYAWGKYYKLYFPWLARRIEKWTFAAAGRAVTVTQAQKAFLQTCHGVEPARVAVCHNAIDPADFVPRADESTKSVVIVGFVGTMNRWQGIPIFRDVIPAVLRDHANARFLLVGGGECQAELAAFIDAQGLVDNVEFAGRVAHAQVPALIDRMDICVLPDSNHYGSPMKVFEYMAMAKAIVAPRVQPVTEVIDAGVTGLIIEPGDAAGMIRAIDRLIDDAELRQALGRSARQYVTTHHTWRHNAETILRLYGELVS